MREKRILTSLPKCKFFSSAKMNRLSLHLIFHVMVCGVTCQAREQVCAALELQSLRLGQNSAEKNWVAPGRIESSILKGNAQPPCKLVIHLVSMHYAQYHYFKQMCSEGSPATPCKTLARGALASHTILTFSSFTFPDLQKSNILIHFSANKLCHSSQIGWQI